MIARSGVPRESFVAGSWCVDLRGEEIADLSFDGRLLLRAIRPVVRDRDWNTVPSRVTGVHRSE